MAEIPTTHDFLPALRRRVEAALESYVYDFPRDSIGNPMREAGMIKELEAMQTALVEPYWVEVEIRDTFQQIDTVAPKRTCAVVAEDGEMLLLFDTVSDEYVLAQRTPSGILTFGVRGDAVGCFMAR
jgi:hypothetical protein